ncbi:hypothetical protein K1719_031469 [Acacia pycnantha]|nr:hypothetical protein K1719_031469 [Acacia pycnantha]
MEGFSCSPWLANVDDATRASGDFSIAVVQANSSLEDQNQVLMSPSAAHIGVCEDHGGPEAVLFQGIEDVLFTTAIASFVASAAEKQQHWC